MTPPRSSTATLVAALRVLERDIVSADGVANAVIDEAAERLQQLHADIATVLPAIGAAAAKASRRTEAGKRFRAAAARLGGEVLA